MLLCLAFLWVGFDLQNASIPVDQIQESGIPVDGIPALKEPEWVSAEEADDFLEETDWVVGLTVGLTVRAYPLRILNWHEVVNDQIADKPILVTYCPLTGTARAFERESGGKSLLFGVSGKRYKNNLLFFDRGTKSLWSQFKGTAVSGPLKGNSLKPIPVIVSPWRGWKEKYPATEVLSLNTGYLRDYSRDPYEIYAASPDPMFSVGKIRSELSPKAWVIGVEMGGRFKAYSLRKLAESGRKRLEDRIGNTMVVIEWLQEFRDARARDVLGNILPSIRTYWFAWQAFYPETEVYNHA